MLSLAKTQMSTVEVSSCNVLHGNSASGAALQCVVERLRNARLHQQQSARTSARFSTTGLTGRSLKIIWRTQPPNIRIFSSWELTDAYFFSPAGFWGRVEVVRSVLIHSGLPQLTAFLQDCKFIKFFKLIDFFVSFIHSFSGKPENAGPEDGGLENTGWEVTRCIHWHAGSVW